MDKLRCGVIGAGGIAAIQHLPEIAAFKAMEVDLVSGRKEGRLRRLCEHFEIPRWTLSYDDVIADDKIDAVIVATPHPLHVEWGIKAIQAGKHLLMQKPLCGSMDQANAFVDAVSSTNKTVLCMPHFPDYVHDLRRLCRAGAIGKVSGARCRTSHGGPEIYYAGVHQFFEEERSDNLWFFDSNQASVGALFDMGVYGVALLVAVLGSMKKVTGIAPTFDKPTTLEDTATLVMQAENGAVLTAETGWCDPARSRELSIHGTAGKFTCPGQQGAAITQWTPTSYTDERAPIHHKAIEGNMALGNVHEHFFSCARQGKMPSLSNAWAARHVTEILLGGLAAARSGTTIELMTRCEA